MRKHIKNFLHILTVLFVTIFFLNSCAMSDEELNSNTDDNIKKTGTILKPVNLNGSAWFSGDSRVDFPTEGENLYMNYFENGLNTKLWIQLKSKGNTTYEAEIVWSDNIREIGKKSAAIIGVDEGKRLSINSEILSITNLVTYEGVTASLFDISKIPTLSTDYLSNFSGSYTLDSKQYTLNIGAKININKDDSHYWNANVLGTTYNEAEKTYDFLLAHSSQKNASGSIDPGITGKEPFISKQGLFWSHMTLTANPGSVWTIKWSSEWKNTPYEALHSEMDMQDTFIGPETSKIKYSYKFYFGNPSKDSSGWCCVDKGDLIYSVEYESDLPTDKSWKEILDTYQINSRIRLPEDKLADYWWYSTKAITGIEDSYVYKLSDNYKPSLTEYEFYLALTDKPADSIYTIRGTYSEENIGCLILTENKIQWNDTIYNIVDAAIWSNCGNGLPLRVAYLVENNSVNYLCSVWYYINNSKDYVKFNIPLESSLSKCPEQYDYQSEDCNTGKLTKALKVQ